MTKWDDKQRISVLKASGNLEMVRQGLYYLHGMLSSIGCVQLTKDASDRLDKILNELMDEAGDVLRLIVANDCTIALSQQ